MFTLSIAIANRKALIGWFREVDIKLTMYSITCITVNRALFARSLFFVIIREKQAL